MEDNVVLFGMAGMESPEAQASPAVEQAGRTAGMSLMTP